MLVSVMMVTYNRLELTKETLDCLFANTKIPFELIIVDNGSNDGTVEYLSAKCLENPYLLNIQIQTNPTNQGIAVGRNQALLLAKGDWLATLDNDVWVPENWLEDCIEILTKNPNYGMVGVNMETASYPLVTVNGVEFQRKPRGNLGTACAVFHRKLHKMLGFFNTEYGLYGEEDADFGMRVRVLGLEMGYLKRNGKHIGDGERDQGEYREFKTAAHKSNLEKFNQNCRAYFQRKKPLYIPFK